MSRRKIALLTDDMTAELQRRVVAACREAELDVDDRQEHGLDGAAAIVAALPVGSRQIPVQAAEAMSMQPVNVPLILLGNEPLVRGHVVLANGRVHLFAPPHDDESTVSRLMHVLAGTAMAGADSLPFRNSDSHLLERWDAEYWLCTLSQPPSTGHDTLGRLTLLEKRADGCFGVFPTETSRQRPQPLVDLFERLLLGDERSLCQWIADLSGKGAVIAYDADTKELVADLPADDHCAAFLVSPHRLPQITHLPIGRPVPLSAAAGDILVTAIGEQALQLLDNEMLRSMARTGAVVGAAVLQQRFAAIDDANAIMMLEARQ